jgi:transcriptional regulator with XRE-family HTH domain
MRNDNFLIEMGAKIKSPRNAQNLSQRQLTEMCNLDAGSFWRIEVGQKNSHILTLKNIADKLGVDVKDFK